MNTSYDYKNNIISFLETTLIFESNRLNPIPR